ncbi:hypothetical protein PLESTM_000489500 [Pleodorina starrii]|nr:hypothetical protein PLESTM_000489500 [Pleodorina starrii]
MLDKYNQRYEKEMRATVKRSGLNMVLPKEVAGSDAVTVFGHVPGVAPGAKYKDRGQLYVVGLHATLMKGIHAPPAKHPDFARGAYSVVMSGGYVDDEDMGELFWYTGEGGIDSSSKRQIKDQSMERGANAALRNNCDSRTPVRVFRGYVSAPVEAEGAAACGDGSGGRGGGGGGGGAKKEKGFVYEGLYVVLQYKMEPSKDGPMVCKFLMYGVPGHSTVNTKVEFGIFGGVSTSRLHARRLAGTGSAAPPPVKRPRVDKDRKAMEVARKVMLADIRRRYSSGSALLSDDVSGGLEAVPIPLINEVNDETLPADFRYIREYEWAPGVLELVSPVLQLVQQEMSQFVCDGVNGTCGLAFNRMIADKDRALGPKAPPGYEPHMEEQYNSAGCLLVTDPCGVHECGVTCTSAKCRLNKQLTNGVVLPLEVFMTPAKGWGVRCRELIPAGSFVCAYVGQLITDHMAEGRKGVDHYLFDLDFFAHIYTEMAEKGLEAIQQEIPLHKIPPVLPIAQVRKVQARAAAVARKLKTAAAATANGGDRSGPATASASAATSAAGRGAGASGSSVRQADGGGGGGGGGRDPALGFLAMIDLPDGVLPPEAIPKAAEDLLASCTAATDPGGSGSADGGGGGSAAAAAAAPPPLVAEATAAAAVAGDDPGAFYLQQIFSKEDNNSNNSNVPAAAAAAAGSGADVEPPPPLAPRSAVAAATGGDDEYAPLLVLDARGSGNVGRFINHSCGGNLTIQAVFGGAYRSTFLYHVGLFASEDIPAMTELTYNYGYHSQARGGGEYGMECHCGAPNCVGQLM